MWDYINLVTEAHVSYVSDITTFQSNAAVHPPAGCLRGRPRPPLRPPPTPPLCPCPCSPSLLDPPLTVALELPPPA